jgi:predicted metal-dependent peptidase
MDQRSCEGSNLVKAQEALNKTKVHLMVKKGTAFLSSISVMLKHEFSEEIPTAATDGLSILYNPAFFMELSKEERLALLAHEVWHVAYQHLIRKCNKDHLLWNMAGDYVINLMLVNSGFTLPKGGLVDKKFTGWSTEQVYDYLKESQDELPEFTPDLIPRELTPEEQEKATGTLVKAVQQAIASDQAGSVPEEILKAVDDLINPKISWTEILYRYFDEKVKEIESWKRPNKKFLPEFYIPSKYNENLGNITVAIDTSGSINKELLTNFLSEINYINKTYKPNSLTILDCDTRIHNIYKVDSFDDIGELQFKGGGGTKLSPVIDYCNENQTNLLLYFTDLYAQPITKEPAYPVLWLCYSDHKPAFIGETIYVKL